MSPAFPIEVEFLPSSAAHIEIGEHKGLGHPDSICDGAAEAASLALCAAYIAECGQVRPHNVDKALLIAGSSRPRFGGGRIGRRPRLILAGRAEPLQSGLQVAEIVRAAAATYIRERLRLPADLIDIESQVIAGSPSLLRVMGPGLTVPLSNDTSFGAGFAPFSRLESAVLSASSLIRSDSFRAEFPAAGDDFKVMGMRVGEKLALTVALALVDSQVDSPASYFSIKRAMRDQLSSLLPEPCDVRLNALDDGSAKDESGLYLTVSGTSAEHGDDGEVGRGNRVNGLITPFRPMSLEAAAGKNPVSHVGKIYNVLANQIARQLVANQREVEGAEVRILSCIGQPIDQPQMVNVRLRIAEAPARDVVRDKTLQVVTEQIKNLVSLTSALTRGEFSVF